MIARPQSTVKPARRGRRPPAAAAATRARVLRRAERLFVRRGYAATSLREVAAASGVRLFTIQHHFGSKARLFEEVMGRWNAEVAALVLAALGQRPAGAGGGARGRRAVRLLPGQPRARRPARPRGARRGAAAPAGARRSGLGALHHHHHGGARAGRRSARSGPAADHGRGRAAQSRAGDAALSDAVRPRRLRPAAGGARQAPPAGGAARADGQARAAAPRPAGRA